MSKKSFYFSHDYNARNDEKILAVRIQLGAEGYGIYFMLLEKMLESSDYSLVKDYNHLAFDLRVSSDKIKSVIEDFGLFQFTDDGKRLQSVSFINRMKPLDNVRKQRQMAGVKSAEKKKQRVREGISAEENFNDRCPPTSTTVATTVGQNFNKVKESKVNNVLLEKEPKERELGQSAISKQQLANRQPLNSETAEKRKKVAEKKEKSANSQKSMPIPSVEEIAEYCHERQNNINAETFWNFYQAKGWLIGKNKMKDWKAAVRTWEQKRKENANTGNHQATSGQQSANGGKISGRDNPFTINDFV